MRRFLYIALLLCLTPLPCAADNFDLTAFREIPILHEGRIKPLESFARSYLLAFNGSDALPDAGAAAWLAELLFDPDNAYQRAVFNVPNPDVVNALGLTWSQSHHYRFNDLSAAFEKYQPTIKAIDAMDDAMRTPPQSQLLELYSKVAAYAIISESVSLLQPRFHIKDALLARKLRVSQDSDLTFLELMPHENEILAATEQLKGIDPNELTRQQRETAFVAMDYLQLSRHEHSTLFRIVPPQWRMDGDTWRSPWSVILEGHGSPQSAEYLALWQKMALAYAHHDTNAWLSASTAARGEAFQLAGSQTSVWQQRLEVFYLRANLFRAALILYIASFVLLMTNLLSGHRLFYKAAACLMPLGAVLQLINIIARISIMGRPPVATLYETTIFVSFIAVLLALIFEWKRRDLTGIITGSILGSVLLFISTRYAAEGDTMEMLVAVLNTNFWLATHVVAVTMGYGCALVAGTLGHIYLIKQASRHQSATQNQLLNATLAVMLIAAFFAMLGTILGGIWADQSWGRFWGWDPKENGAMFIVLWLLWLLHGRVANVLTPLRYAAGAALTNVVVALSWFGVNLLGVGLHSYGFTNHIALNLSLFCGAEILFVAGVLLYLRTLKRDAI